MELKYLKISFVYLGILLKSMYKRCEILEKLRMLRNRWVSENHGWEIYKYLYILNAAAMKRFYTKQY